LYFKEFTQLIKLLFQPEFIQRQVVRAEFSQKIFGYIM